jgi:hypothetical protein
MSGRDYSKQVEKRQRIRSTSLVVGVDVGKAYNAVGFMNKEGKVLGSCAKVYNSREGFEQFLKMAEDVKARYGLKDVLIGMEPTGHYWRKLAYFARERGYEVRFIRTTALKHHRELDESASAQHPWHRGSFCYSVLWGTGRPYISIMSVKSSSMPDTILRRVIQALG